MYALTITLSLGVGLFLAIFWTSIPLRPYQLFIHTPFFTVLAALKIWVLGTFITLMLKNFEKAESYNYEPDRFVVQGKHVFVYCEGKYHQTKINNNFFENKLKATATTRNWKTVIKLLELSK